MTAINRAIARVAVLVAGFTPIAWIIWGAFTDNLGANPIDEVQLQTGRWGMRFLAISLAISPIRKLTGWNGIIRLRRTFGLFAFFYATLHLINFIAIDKFFDVGDIVEDIAKHLYITVGMATWLTLVPLALTSTRSSIRRLGGKRWNRLHRLVYVAAVGATVHYLWAVKKDTLYPLLYLALFVVLLGYRVWSNRDRLLVRTKRFQEGGTA
ncbi:MAG TPA: protein-methionine-sulfoxide reductase heme-binding subunit MsrQ [Gemmatimonadaceae bacterium]|nr:protein-methionine-sulfoxide reductase heme-binding subunit MsrQ [Gemmatimonadaceae bacterium]